MKAPYPINSICNPVGSFALTFSCGRRPEYVKIAGGAPITLDAFARENSLELEEFYAIRDALEKHGVAIIGGGAAPEIKIRTWKERK